MQKNIYARNLWILDVIKVCYQKYPKSQIYQAYYFALAANATTWLNTAGSKTAN